MSHHLLKQFSYGLVMIVGLAIFGVANRHVTELPRSRIDTVMNIALPTPIQLLMSGGDSHLAANIGVFRAVTVGVFPLKPETYKVLADVQLSAAQLNPKHEDNYYTAAAILAWNEQTSAAQSILKKAMEARTNDALPPFFHGFNQYYFYGDLNNAAKDMRLAAERSEGANKLALQGIAQRWSERGQSPTAAIDFLQKLFEQSQNRQFRAVLAARIARLQGLVTLQAAEQRFVARENHPLDNLQQLITSGELAALPVDPTGLGYTLNAQKKPALAVAKDN